MSFWVVTVTVTLSDAVQVLASIAVTTYSVSSKGETVIVPVVSPVFHIYETPPFTFKLVDWPSQTPNVPVMFINGSGLTVTVVAAGPPVLKQLFPSIANT